MAAFFFQNLPGLFHPGTLLGFSLQGFFPSQSLRRLSALVTFMTLTLQPRDFRSELPSINALSEPAFKALLSAKIRHPSDLTLAKAHGPLPSWASDL